MKPAANTGTLYICKIKDGCSILAPVIEIYDHSAELFDYNYCWIGEFNRFYFIDDIIMDQNVWTITSHVDVLATYKSDITGSYQYVSRAASKYDGNLIDSLYVTRVNDTISKVSESEYAGQGTGYEDYVNSQIIGENTTITSKYFNVPFTGGYFVVGVVGNNASGTTFYIMGYSAFKDFISKVFVLDPSDMSDVSTGVGNAIYDPIQYITFCRWYPCVSTPTGSTGTNTIRVGRYSAVLGTGNLAYALNSTNVERFHITIDVPGHPDASTRPYLNLPPFTEYSLYFEPFGVLPIDASKIFDQKKIYIEWDVDFCSGLAVIRIRPWDDGSSKAIIYTTSSDYGVTIPISSLAMDWKAGAALSIGQFIKNSYTSGLAGRSKPSYMSDVEWGEYTTALADYSASTSSSGGFLNAVNTVMDVTASALGQLVTKGAAGSFMAYNAGRPILYAWHQLQKGFNDVNFGRPLEAYTDMNTLSGFVLCVGAQISSFGVYSPRPLQSEYNMIVQYLDSGVYLE